MKKLLRNSGYIFSLRQKNILSAAIVLMVLIFISSFLGLLRNRLLAGTFFSGQERLLDVYFAAFRLPDMLYQLLVLGGLSAAFIPTFSEYMQKDKNEANKVASSAINIAFVSFIFLALLVFVFAKVLSRLLAPGFTGEEFYHMVRLTRLLLLAQAFFLLSSFLTGILQSYERFLLPAVSAVLYNLSIIGGIVFFSHHFSIYGVVYGVMIGAFLHFLIQVPLTLKLGFNYSFLFNFRDPGVKKIFHLMLPRMLSLFTTQIFLSVSIFIASSLSAGALALYSFSQNIVALPVSLFGLTIGQASLPSLSREASRDKEKFKELFLQSCTQIVYLSLPAGIVLLVLRIPLVRLALGAKNFPWEATILTAKLVAVFSVSIVWQSLTQLLVRFFYAKQDTKTPFWLNMVNALIGIAFSYLLVYVFKFDIVGLAIAGSLSAFTYALCLIFFIGKKAENWFSKVFVNYIGRIFGINLLLSLFLWLLMKGFDHFLDTTKTLNLIILTVLTLFVSLSLYTILSCIFRIKEIYSLLAVIKSFGRWKQIFSQSEEILEGNPGYD